MNNALTTYTISETLPCWVTFYHRVKAANVEEAMEAHYNSQSDCIGTEIGETISWLDHTGLEIEEAS